MRLNCWEAVFLFLSYDFIPDGILIPKSGISALKTNRAVSQMDNTASSTYANRQISLQNRYNSFLKSICNAVCHRLYRHCTHRFTQLFFVLSCFFCTAVSLFALSTNGADSFFINFYFLTALPFFLFSMFFMFMGVLFVFCFTVVLFFSVCMF